jgi:hypothetical protein
MRALRLVGPAAATHPGIVHGLPDNLGDPGRPVRRDLRLRLPPGGFCLGDQPGRSGAAEDRGDLLSQHVRWGAVAGRSLERLLDALHPGLGDPGDPVRALGQQGGQSLLVTFQAAQAEDLNDRRPAERGRRGPQAGEDAADHRADRGSDPGCGQVLPGGRLCGLSRGWLLLDRLLARALAAGFAGDFGGPTLDQGQPAAGDQLGIDGGGQLPGQVLGVLVG